MTTCTIPPKGWTCSRDAGHEGPCAARQEPFPYDEYVTKVLNEIDRLEEHGSMSRRELRGYLTDAWLAGLGHSLNIIETQKTKRTFTELEKQYEGKPQCDWPWP